MLSKNDITVEAKTPVSESLKEISESIPPVDTGSITEPADRPVSPAERTTSRVELTRFNDFEPRAMTSDHPFRHEAQKILSGRLEETDSLNRRRILSYCEHLRTSYTTRDIDFIRQVFSDNALIIVGHVVQTGDDKAATLASNPKVRYSVRSKREYLERLSKLFDSDRKIDVRFSDFRILRHPTVNGIYGVTLRQKYTAGTYTDDGYLFLLWDFRDPGMPLIHVRTWQPTLSLTGSDDELIDISDFNLE
ncbi:MAG: hypothetical protein K2K84_03575 [Muribaculaceae bacterium]|nr:hypothetical protein [Muribaculaceae bacterium]